MGGYRVPHFADGKIIMVEVIPVCIDLINHFMLT